MSNETLNLTATRQPSGYLDIDVEEAHRNLGAFRVIDVREPHEYHGELSHIPGAELVPLDTVPQAADAWDRDEPLLMICRSGARSGRAAEFLKLQGFKAVHNMVGGMLRWNEIGLPTQRNTADVAARAAQAGASGQ